MDDNIKKYIHNLLSHQPDKLLATSMALKHLPDTILLLKVNCFEGFRNHIKIMEW